MAEITTGFGEFTVVGLMSGTSLDGVDCALCRFSRNNYGSWQFTIEKVHTFPYHSSWKDRLIKAETASGLELMMLHKEFGIYLGTLTLEFLKDIAFRPDFISSHGHTIFHQPFKKLTFQLGDGAYLAAKAGLTTISDFRNLDVALGGQGAPLVPVGDQLLFGKYDQCLNLGGFSNISFTNNNNRLAFDICPVNILLNWLSHKYYGTTYDKDGLIGQTGKIDTKLLLSLNNLDFYKQPAPKSLGKEWVLEFVLPLFENADLPPENQMRTAYEHISIQISQIINSMPGTNILLTGGGALNHFLVKLLQDKTRKKIEIPESNVIEFKEALIFAFLGVLRYLNLPNCMASVTGASQSNSGGIIHHIL